MPEPPPDRDAIDATPQAIASAPGSVTGCDALNPPGRVVPPLPEGIATGSVSDYGRAHIEQEQGDHASNEKGHFRLGTAEDMRRLEAIRDQALVLAATQGIAWYPSPERVTGVDNGVLDPAYPGIGTRMGNRPGTRKVANRLRIVARATPPHEIVTMFPF